MVEVEKINSHEQYNLQPVGHGVVNESSTVLREDFEGVDTALELVSEISLTFK
jgi:hypothetical protein